EAYRQIAHHIALLIHVRLVDETWRGGLRTRAVAEIRQLTGGLEGGRPVTHLAYRSDPGGEEYFSPEPGLLAELAPFNSAWEE
ncbi:MAG: secretion protein, partial [Propionibacteriaceae bacterium]|nr:secretion protein [Propionibacteriaceae bacterium]